MSKGKVVEFKTKDGKIVRKTTIDMSQLMKDKLTNNPLLEELKAEFILYKGKGDVRQVVDRQFLPFNEAVNYGKQAVREFPELNYQVIQIVE